MHWFDIAMTGPTDALERVARELDPSRPGAFAQILTISRAEPSVTLRVEGFREFEDEVMCATIIAGDVSDYHKETLLPESWGSFDDEDRMDLDADRVADAARRLLEQPIQPDRPTGLGAGLAAAVELGRFAEAVMREPCDVPTPAAVEAIVALARRGLQQDNRYARARQVTKAAVHARRDGVFHDTWADWLKLVLECAADVVNAAGEPPPRDEQLDRETYSLLLTCLQALAVFGGATTAGRRASK